MRLMPVATAYFPETFQKGPGCWSTIDKFPLYIREGAIIPMEITNTFSGFGWPESADYVTLAIWPKLRGESSFTLRDTEGPVRITATRNDDASLVLTWDATRRNHLLRVHIDGASVPCAVRADGVPLAKTSDLDAFRKTAAEGWYYDAAEQKLWIRKLNNGSAASIEVRLKP
jgi:alpha-D-xyloside xylohydrolase